MAEEKKAKQKGAPAAEATGAPAVKPVSVAEKLRACLVAVKKVVGDDKTCFETLLKMLGNVANAPGEAKPMAASGSLKWSCGCGGVILAMQGEPYFTLDCHCSACVPVAKYLDAKSNGKGASPIVNETGVAKAFFMLDKVKFVQGKDKVAGVKLGETGANVRAYTTCCSTQLICDSPVPFPFRPFNRCCLKNEDGSPYVPAEPAWGCKGGDNPWWDAVPEPKHPTDPDWLVDEIKALEVDGHGLGSVGDFDGDTTPGFFAKPEDITEFVPKT